MLTFDHKDLLTRDRHRVHKVVQDHCRHTHTHRLVHLKSQGSTWALYPIMQHEQHAHQIHENVADDDAPGLNHVTVMTSLTVLRKTKQNTWVMFVFTEADKVTVQVYLWYLTCVWKVDQLILLTWSDLLFEPSASWHLLCARHSPARLQTDQ